jgi:hypothetical protein
MSFLQPAEFQAARTDKVKQKNVSEYVGDAGSFTLLN